MTLSVQLRHAYAGFTLDVAFDAPSGVTALFGRSGSGKTSVVDAVAGLLIPHAGRVAVDRTVLLDTGSGLALPPHRRRLGYVFQDGRLFPHLSVRRNLLYGHRFAPQGGGVTFDRVVEMLGIGSLLSRRPGTLSGGEKQRVAIGRALLCNPRLLLMDEPLAALDDARKAEILPFLERLRDEAGIPILYVSHSIAEVARLATTLIVLEAGRVVGVGPVAAMLSAMDTAPLFGARYAGAFLRARIAGQEVDGLTRLDTAAGVLLVPRVEGRIGTALRVRIHAQDVILSRARPVGLSALNVLPVTVTGIAADGEHSALIQMRVGEDVLLARVTQRSARALDIAVGAQVFAILKSVAVAREDIAQGQGSLT